MSTDTKIRKRVRIIQDTDAQSPREDSCCLGTMVCWHRRYNLGDEQPKTDPRSYRRSLAAEYVGAGEDLIPEEHIDRIFDKHFVTLPLYLYDHSGITMSTTSFSCPWDSGKVGFIYCSFAAARGAYNLPPIDADWSVHVGDEETPLGDAVRRSLQREVEVYDQYIRGDVYGFVVEEWWECKTCHRGNWEHVDSCYGFYGRDPRNNGMEVYLSKEELQLACQAEVEV